MSFQKADSPRITAALFPSPVLLGALPRRYLAAIVIILWVFGAGSVHAERIIYAYPSPSTSFLPLVVAQKKGFCDPENLQPELVQILSPQK